MHKRHAGGGERKNKRHEVGGWWRNEEADEKRHRPQTKSVG